MSRDDTDQHDPVERESRRKLFVADGTPLDDSASATDWLAGAVLGMIDEDGDIVWSGQPNLMKPRPKT